MILLRIRQLLGGLLNLSRVPGLVQQCEIEQGVEGVYKANIRVRISPLFTVITVNGLDLYFYRLTGGFDGTGMAHNGEPIRSPYLVCNVEKGSERI